MTDSKTDIAETCNLTVTTNIDGFGPSEDFKMFGNSSHSNKLKTAETQTSQSLWENFHFDANCQTSQSYLSTADGNNCELNVNDKDQQVPSSIADNPIVVDYIELNVNRSTLKRLGLSKKAKVNPLHRKF